MEIANTRLMSFRRESLRDLVSGSVISVVLYHSLSLTYSVRREGVVTPGFIMTTVRSVLESK